METRHWSLLSESKKAELKAHLLYILFRGNGIQQWLWHVKDNLTGLQYWKVAVTLPLCFVDIQSRLASHQRAYLFCWGKSSLKQYNPTRVNVLLTSQRNLWSIVEHKSNFYWTEYEWCTQTTWTKLTKTPFINLQILPACASDNNCKFLEHLG
jgi:hypothetical protein